MKHFNQVTNVNEAKQLYKKLAFQYHPDMHQDEFDKYNEIMKEVNVQYQAILKSFDNQEFEGTDGKYHTYHYNENVEWEVAVKIQDLISMKMEDVEIWLIGTWVWVEGNTYPHKDTLKKNGLRWHSKRKMWYYRQAQYKRSYSGKSFNEIKRMYGARKVDNDEKSAIAAD